MSKEKEPLKIDLFGDQSICNDFEDSLPIIKGEGWSNFSKELRHTFLSKAKKIFCKEGGYGITRFCYDDKSVAFNADGSHSEVQTILESVPGTCHGATRHINTNNLTVFYNYFHFPSKNEESVDLPTSPNNSKYMLFLFSKDSPFASVVNKVTFVLTEDSTKLRGVIFRDVANLDLHLFSNLLIWTRRLTEFKQGVFIDDLCEKHKFSFKEAWSLLPYFCTAVLSNKTIKHIIRGSNSGDCPAYFGYISSEGYYSPKTFLNNKLHSTGVLVKDALNKKASFNPCNYVCSKTTTRRSSSNSNYRIPAHFFGFNRSGTPVGPRTVQFVDLINNQDVKNKDEFLQQFIKDMYTKDFLPND